MTTPTAPRRFSQVDVFTDAPYLGNPVAVVHDADGLTDEQMAAFTRWTNLSEATFLLPPTRAGAAAGADYRVRIFTASGELPFAGHPTLGSAHAWLDAGGVAREDGLVQECGIGLVTLRRGPDGLAFAAPDLLTDAPVDDATLTSIVHALGVPAEAVADHRVLENGPAWRVLLLDSAERVLGLEPDWSGLDSMDVGVLGPYDEKPRRDGGPAFEVRGFALAAGVIEDPVTGSLNAGIGQWLTSTDRAPARYTARQGTALGRDGRVYVSRDGDGTVWVGGGTVTCVTGTVRF